MTREELLAKYAAKNPIANRELVRLEDILDYIDTAVTLAGIVTDLPTADPEVAGQLWNDTGTVKVSAGA